jgi:hypothetical protein
LNSHRALEQTVHMDTDKDSEVLPDLWYNAGHVSSADAEHITTVALHNFRLCNVFSLFDKDLGYWVKPRSTTWFSRFLLEQYGEDRWIQIFRMSKRAVFALTDLLRPHIQKQDTKYQFAIPVLVHVAMTLFKFTHGASLFVCSEMFAVGKSMCSTILRDTVRAINEVICHESSWPTGDTVLQIQHDFRRLCGLPTVIRSY